MKKGNSLQSETWNAVWEGLIIGSVIASGFASTVIAARTSQMIDSLEQIDSTLKRIEKQSDQEDNSITLEKETGE